jgi:hypothetical protein
MFEGLKHLSKAKAIHNWFIISELFTTKADFFTSTITDGLQARQSRNNKTRGGGTKREKKKCSREASSKRSEGSPLFIAQKLYICMSLK